MVVYFTRLKYIRIAKQKEAFKKIKALQDAKIEINPEFVKHMQEQKENLEYLQGKEGARPAPMLDVHNLDEGAPKPQITPRGNKIWDDSFRSIRPSKPKAE